MIVGDRIVSRIGELVAEAERRILESYREGRIKEEPSITDRFCQEIERVFEEHSHDGTFRLRAKTLTSHGPNAEEREYGANVVVVLDVNMTNFRENKGFLAQAKKSGDGKDVTANASLIAVQFADNKRIQQLKGQIMLMKKISLNENFVFIYTSDGFYVVPGHSVVDLMNGGKVYGTTISNFFKLFMMCYIGDHRLNAYDDDTLEALAGRSDARTGLLIGIEPNTNRH